MRAMSGQAREVLGAMLISLAAQNTVPGANESTPGTPERHHGSQASRKVPRL